MMWIVYSELIGSTWNNRTVFLQTDNEFCACIRFKDIRVYCMRVLFHQIRCTFVNEIKSKRIHSR